MDECKPLVGGPGAGGGRYGDTRRTLRRLSPGRAVQVDPIKPTLKPTGNKRLKLKCDTLLSTSAFKSNLRRYTLAAVVRQAAACLSSGGHLHYLGTGSAGILGGVGQLESRV